MALDKTTITQTDASNQQAGNHNTQNNFSGVPFERHEALFEKYTLTKAAAERLWKIVQEQTDAFSDPVKALDQLAEKYKELLDQVEKSENTTPESATLKKAAKQALDEGDVDRAEKLLNDAAAVDLQQIDHHWKSVTESYEQIAKLKEVELAYLEAADYYAKAANHTPRSEHRKYGYYLTEQAMRLKEGGQYQSALNLLEEVVELAEKEFDANDDLAATFNNLANLYQVMGHYEEAEPLYQRALSIGEKTLGSDHPKMAVWSNNLASWYQKMGRYEEAEPLYQRALLIGEKTLGSDHPTMAVQSNNLASLYQDMGRYEEAEPLYQRALLIGEKTLGSDHPDMAIWSNNLALLYQAMGRYEEAEPLYQRALSIAEKALGLAHPDTKGFAQNYAIFLIELGRKPEAEVLTEKFALIESEDE